LFGASVKQFSSGIPHSREFWAMAMRPRADVSVAFARRITVEGRYPVPVHPWLVRPICPSNVEAGQ
jgi:hypothetical protein